ncbi:MAG: hypothetical protein ACLSHU_04525 [Oscillospiraceae bacterium]
MRRRRASLASCSWGVSPRSRPPCGWERVSPPWPISSVFCVTVPPCWRPCGLPVLTERHARALLKLPQEEQKLAAIAVIVERGLTVARTERYIEELLAQAARSPRPPRAPDVRGFLSSLTQSLALIQSAGIAAVSHQQETDREITLTITIPKEIS